MGTKEVRHEWGMLSTATVPTYQPSPGPRHQDRDKGEGCFTATKSASAVPAGSAVLAGSAVPVGRTINSGTAEACTAPCKQDWTALGT